MVTRIEMKPGETSLADLRAIWSGGVETALPEAARRAIAASRAAVERAVAGGATLYGINTGFGLLANTRIADDKLAELQRRIVLSHAAGIGEPLSERVVRLTMALKVLSLARGHSGVRPVVVEALLALLNAGVTPVVPGQGSVGASG